jgi:transposase-like protein
MFNDGELPQPETNREKHRIVQMPNQVLPRVQWHIHIVHVQIHTFSQVPYTQTRTLIVLEFLPKNTLQRN